MSRYIIWSIIAVCVFVLVFLVVRYPASMTALVGIATFIAILVYVSATNKMAQATYDMAQASKATVDEMRKTRDLETRPYVVMRPYDAPDGNLCVLITNHGKTAACDIQI